MSPQLYLLKALLNKDLYAKYRPLLKSDIKELSILFSNLDTLHEKYQKDLSLEEFSLFVVSTTAPKDLEVINELLKDLQSIDTSSSVFEDILIQQQQKQRAYELAILALEVSEGKKQWENLTHSVKDLNSTESALDPSVSFVTSDLQELYNGSIAKQGLRWRLNTLNRMLGSLRLGDFGFIFARPETGKTTFLASEVTNFAQQLADGSGPVLWFNNEEQGSKVQIRCYQALLGYNLTELFADVDGNRKKYHDLGGGNIKIYDSAAIHRRQVEVLCQQLQPSLIIFDQIDKIKGFTDDREDLRLGAIYIWARELAKTYCPVIGVSQADASGEGKKYLTMDNVANAKTAKQAEADWILGIGKDHSETGEYLRYLHLCKNKLSGDEDTDPDKRHGRETVIIQPEVARYSDMQ